ncbi:unnamed protein product [Brachionus calyciflorus]|uniref:Uncharacterized protein n=1 Tax=Brachionus calyciflorus TaxID=104777 RepID=A0A814ESS4_9BILA|nr:unnamed protein product [Brachionus calyciflorus]
MGGKKSKPSSNFQNQSYQYNSPFFHNTNHDNFGQNNHHQANHGNNHHNRMNNHNHHRHNRCQHHQNNKNHARNNMRHLGSGIMDPFYHPNQDMYNQNHENNFFGENQFNPYDDYGQNFNENYPNPMLNHNFDNMNFNRNRRMRRRPRPRRRLRRRPIDPFRNDEFLAENNPEFLLDPRHRPRYLSNREVKFMKNRYWNPLTGHTSSHPSSHPSTHPSTHPSSHPSSNIRESQQREISAIPEPLQISRLEFPPLKKINIPKYRPNQYKEHKPTESQAYFANKVHVVNRYNKKNYASTIYAKPIKPPTSEHHIKIVDKREKSENPFKNAKYFISSIRVPRSLANQVTFEIKN